MSATDNPEPRRYTLREIIEHLSRAGCSPTHIPTIDPDTLLSFLGGRKPVFPATYDPAEPFTMPAKKTSPDAPEVR